MIYNGVLQVSVVLFTYELSMNVVVGFGDIMVVILERGWSICLEWLTKTGTKFMYQKLVHRFINKEGTVKIQSYVGRSMGAYKWL